MIAMLSLENVLAWAAQVSVLIGMGAILPAVFRIRHPRWHLVYFHALLFSCLVLPFVQPWRHPEVSSGTAWQPGHAESALLASSAPTVAGAVQWTRVLGWIVLAGMAARLCWFLAGLWRIRRYRAAASPLRWLPESVRRAQSLTNRAAVICVSVNDIGPAAVGLLRPTVILPQSFFSLEQDAQCAIACHELLHVKRNDWIMTVLEELIGACLWFHPAVWWLLGQTRLAREQVVDAEVVRLTAAPDPYIDALLMMSNAHPDRVLPAAPLFLHKRHLIQRLRCLVMDGPISTLRLISSYASMSVVLAALACLASTSFPLMGQPQIAETVLPEQSFPQIPAAAAISQRTASVERVFRVGGGVTAPTLIKRVDPEYPDPAREALTQGTVVVQGIVQSDGALTVTGILRNLDPQLDRNALDAMKQWRFEPGRLRGTPVPVEIDIEVHFNLKLRGGTPKAFRTIPSSFRLGSPYAKD